MLYKIKLLKATNMKTIIIILALSFTLASCASIKDKIPNLKKCDGSNETLADVFCKKN